MNLEKIFSKLVSFPTISESSNELLIDYIIKYLKDYNLEAIKIEGHKNRFNLYCKIGPNTPGGIILSGHTDVVPVLGQNWSTNPFKLISKNNKYFGRGTCDMKGFLATVLNMIPKIKKLKLLRPIHLIFSYDEEVGCVGIQRLIPFIEKIKLKPKYCIVGEPTNMKLINKHKGKKTYEVIFNGIESHSSLINDGVNTIDYGSEFIIFLKSLQDLFKKKYTNSEFSPPYPTINVGKIYGGSAVNIIPNKCNIDFEIRDTPDLKEKKFDLEIRSFLKKLEKKMKLKNPNCSIGVIKKNSFPSLKTPRDSEIISMCLKSLKSNQTGTVSFGTEAGVFDNLNIETIVCGPGNIKQAHKPNEFIEKDQLTKCDTFINNFLSQINSC